MKRQVLFLCLAIFFVSVFVTRTDGKATLKKCKKKSYRAKHRKSCGKLLAKVKANSTSNATSHATSKNATSSNTTSSNITSSTTTKKNTSTLLHKKINWGQFTNKLLEDNNSTKVTKRKKRTKSKKTTSSPDDPYETSTKTSDAKTTKGNGTSTLNSTISKLTKLKNVTKDSTTSESTKKSTTKLTKKSTNATKTKDEEDSDAEEITTKSPTKSTTQVDSEETDTTTKPPKKKRKKKTKKKTTQEPEEEDDPKAKFLSYLKDKEKGAHRMKYYANKCLTKSSRKKYEATKKEQHKMKCKVFLKYYKSLKTTTEEPEDSAEQNGEKETEKPTKKPRKAGEKPGLGSIPEDDTTDTTTKKKATKKPKTSKKKTKRPTKSKKNEEDTETETTKKPKKKIVELDASVKGTECPKSDKKTACSPTFSIDIGKGVKEAAKYEVKVQLEQSPSTKLDFKAETPIEFTVFTDVSYTLTISALDKKDKTIAKKTFKGQKINGTLPYSSIRLTCESKKKKTLCSAVSLNKMLKDEGLLRSISADPEGNDLLSSSLNSKEKKALEGIRAKLARKGAKVILAQVRDEGRKGAYESESGSFLSVRNIIVVIALLIGTIFVAWQMKSGTLSQYFKSNSDDPFRDSLNGPDVELGSGLTSDAASRALASPAGQFVEAVLKKKGIPDFGIQKYMKKLADINISSLEQLVALDQKDWERAGFEEEIVAAIEDELPSKRARKPSKPSKSKGLSLKRNSGKKKPASLARAQAEISTEDEESPDGDGDGDGGSDSIDFDDDDLLSFSKPKKTKKKKRPIKDDSETNDWEDF